MPMLRLIWEAEAVLDKPDMPTAIAATAANAIKDFLIMRVFLS